MLIPYQKPALSFEEQLEKLEYRGLDVKDRSYALSALSTISYYRLSGYWHPYRMGGSDASDFIAGTAFDDAITLYEFDRHLRLLIMDAIERVEVHVRTLIAYQLGHTYGAFGHIDPANFHPKFNHADWLKKLEIEAHRSKDTFISHYKRTYENFPTLPIWVTTEIMSFGSLSFCYTGMKNEDKKEISSNFGVHHRRLKDWLHKLTYVRNVCAHHSRLWNRELAVRPEDVRDQNWNAPITPRKDRVFYILLILRSFLRATNNGEHWAKQCNTLIESSVQEKRFFQAMGIPDNWREHPIWK